MNYLLIDGNSLGHYCNATKPLTVGDMQVNAIYHFLRNLRQAVGIYMHYQPIVLWDGVSWRYKIYNEYKANRDKKATVAERKQALAKDKYKKQLPLIKKGLEFLGVPQITATNMEADDLGAILADRYSAQGKVILYTGDQDWIQLVGPNVVWRDFAQNRTVNHSNFQEFTGVETTSQFVEIKALSGDSGDNIAGVGGIGGKGAIEFLTKYGSFNQFLEMVTLDRSIDIAKLPKKYRNLVEDEGRALKFDHNIKLMDLRTSARPAMEGFHLEKGMPCRDRFRIFCNRLSFASVTKDLDEWMSVFPAFRPSE